MSDPEKSHAHEAGEQAHLEAGPYVVRSLIRDVALSAGGDEADVRITCVEVWKENLYIGTSTGELLHYFKLPPDPNDPPSTPPTYIEARRFSPPTNQPTGPGIQQILLLPSVSKACILTSSTLTFYTLPELAPAFPQLKPLTCGWVGGVDLNAPFGDGVGSVAIMMCLRNKIRLVGIGETAVKERDIEFGGCLATVRRGNVACVADGRSYALVDVVAQQKFPLLPISSLEEPASQQAGGGAGQAEGAWPSGGGGGRASRSSSVAGNRERLAVQDKGHSRSTSLGIFRTESPLGDSPRNSMTARHGFDVPAIFNRQTSPRPPEAAERRSSLGPDVAKPLPAPPQEPPDKAPTPPPKPAATSLGPVIASPNDSEFLLVTGTAPSEPGLGMFVNLDGEIVRGTLEFSSFPESMVTDGRGVDLSVSQAQMDDGAAEEGYVLSVVRGDGGSRAIEVQRWDLEPGEGGAKEWLGVPDREANGNLGIRRVADDVEFELFQVVDLLAQKTIQLSEATSDRESTPEKVTKREAEERAYYQRMSHAKTSILVWSGTSIHWTLRNPLVLRLDARLRLAERSTSDQSAPISPQRKEIERLINDLRGHPSLTELEFYTLSYIRQKAALLLFIDLVLQTAAGNLAFESDKRTTEEALIESEIDPRFILHFLPGIASENLSATEGIWVQGGIHSLIHRFISQIDVEKLNTNPQGPYGENLLKPIKRFLLTWRTKRGNPSVVDGSHVFPTVDAALLLILLTLDAASPPGPATAGSVRAELNALVDGGVECFDRAVSLLTDHKRLYVLSRLYQSKKNSAKVLDTWRRIISGAEDAGGEFAADGEVELKTYLTKLRNRTLVQEYGAWLASRNPRLGVQVFADEGSRTTWPPADALSILRESAPGAVRVYLEYLVFSKKQSQHINELIAYYLDIVVAALSDPSSHAEETLQATYETYRALQPPKPTYRHFIEDNAMPAEWWDARLRLLALLGETGAEGEGYDVDAVREKLGRYEKALVPEMIILHGRKGEHDRAISLLVHGLGDFDMAISYCLRGGYTQTTASPTSPSTPSSSTFDKQKALFTTLLHALLSLPDLTSRIERTSELLERFGAWFEVEDVLKAVPTGWSVEIFGAFLVGALGRLVRERNETRVVRALWGGESLRVQHERIVRIEGGGAVVEKVGAVDAVAGD